MDTSHSKGKRPRPTDKSPSLGASQVASASKESVAKGAFLVSIALKEDARPFGSFRAGEFVLNDRGRALTGCWRELGRSCAGLRPDAILVGPRHFQGILFLSPDGRGAPSLSEAVRLFKVLASLRLSQAAKGARPSARTALSAKASVPGPVIPSATVTSVLSGISPSALWKKGYTERPLADAADLSEARKALKAIPTRS